MNENPVIEFCYYGIEWIEKDEKDLNQYFQSLEIVFSKEIQKLFEKEIFLLKEILEKHNWNGKFIQVPEKKKLKQDLSDYIKLLSNLEKDDFFSKPDHNFPLEKEKTLFYTFNQEQNCFAISTDQSIRIFTCNPFQKVFSRDGGMSIVKMHHSSSLIAMIGAGEQSKFSPRKLFLFDVKTQHVILEMLFKESIVNLFFSKSHLIVVLKKQISIFDVKTCRKISTVSSEEISIGNVDYVETNNYTLLAYPSSQPGHVVLMNVSNCEKIENLKAHESPLEIVKFSPDGKLFATCSTYGTNVRVYNVLDRKLLCSFKRGNRSVKIVTINFNQSATLIAVGSENGTIHVYKIEKSQEWFGSQLSSFLFSGEYSLIKGISCPFICGFVGKELVVVCQNGVLQRHRLGDLEQFNGDSLIEELNWFKLK